MTEGFYAVIMAGGGGTRLWPVSRRERPKQTQPILGEQTLFQISVERLQPMLEPQQIYVVTVTDQAAMLEAQVSSLPKTNYMIEPSPRGTASVVGLAAIKLHRKDPNCVMAVVTADHFIADVQKFQELLMAARQLALEGDLVTLGITAQHPDTGYGYIQRGEARGVYNGLQAFRVRAFREKPDLATAETYVASGEYAWNSGMFVWKTESILAEIERQMPNLFSGLQEIERALGKKEEQETIAQVWDKLESQTVDFGIMEGARNVSVIPADDLGWCDVGGWSRLFEVMEKDPHGNIIHSSNSLVVDCRNTLVYQEERLKEGRLIVALGTEDLVLVDMGDVVFVCPKDKAESVRKVVQLLQDQGLGQYL